ncbi:hypothetical protein HRG_014800 [Hirsutella rhossiliensis]
MEDQRRPSRAAGYPASADTEERPARTERNPVSADGGDRRALAAADEKFGRSTGHSAPADMEGRRSFTAVERDRFGCSLGRKQGAPQDTWPQPTWRAAGPSPPSSGTSPAVVSAGSQHVPRAIQSRPASRARPRHNSPQPGRLLAAEIAHRQVRS